MRFLFCCCIVLVAGDAVPIVSVVADDIIVVDVVAVTVAHGVIVAAAFVN